MTTDSSPLELKVHIHTTQLFPHVCSDNVIVTPRFIKYL